MGDTYSSSANVDGLFFMVRRGAVRGDQPTIVFRNVGTNGASSVAYGVQASPHPNPWGDVVFPLGVKPIGFANSCWRVFVGTSDTGLVLEIGP